MIGEDEVSVSGKHSVVPSEPWRYACPDCDSVSVQPRASNRVSGRSYRADGGGRAEADQDRYKHYSCNVCHTAHKRVIDRKEDRLADPLDRL